MRKKKITKTINEMYVSALDPLLDGRSLINDEDFRAVVSIDYKYQMCSIIEQALKLKFPNIKHLVVDHSWEDEFLHVEFQEDEMHTRKIIEDYLEQMKEEVKTFKL